MTLSQEKIFYHYLRQNPSYFKYVFSYFFKDAELRVLLDIDKKFYGKYKDIAKKNQLIQLIDKKGSEEFYVLDKDQNKEFNHSLLDNIFDIDIDSYDMAWLVENFETWIEWKTLEHSLADTIKLIKISNVTPSNIKDIVETVKNIINEKNSISFEDTIGTDILDSDDYFLESKESFTTGYNWIDSKLGGGLSYKTLTVFFGRAKIGKSLVLGNLATNIVKNGYNVLLVTLELSEKKYLKRIASNILDVPIDEYDNFILDKKKLKKKIDRYNQPDGMTMKIPGKLIIKEFPTSTLRAPDLEAYIQKAESKLKINFDVVIIDYLNLMQDTKNPNSESSYLKVKNIAEQLRAMATRRSLAVITATQANRMGMTKQGALAMEDVSESIGLAFTVDALFSINQDDIDKEKNEYTFTAVALRDAEGIGEQHRFSFDRTHLRVTQLPDDLSQNFANSYF